MGFVKVFTE